MGARKRPCVYCGNPGETKDHVPPKLLLDEPYPANLKTVPSCRACNTGASADEEYLRILLAQIGTTQTLTSKIEEGGVVDRALRYSEGLAVRIEQSLRVSEDGRVHIKPEHARVNRVIEKIANGLYFLRYKSRPPSPVTTLGVFPYNIQDLRPIALTVATFTERFRTKRWNVVQRGVFSYIFVRSPLPGPALLCVMDLHATAWGVVQMPMPPRRKTNRLTHLIQQDLFR